MRHPPGARGPGRRLVQWRMRRPTLVLAAFGLMSVLLAACAPAGSDARVSVQQLTQPISFYPQQTGARWEYLPDGAKLDDPRLVVTVEGPTVLDGEVWTAWHLVGRGLDITRYRQYRPDGVYLRQEEKLGTLIRFDPPMQEFPAQDQLRVGATWSGDTTVTVNATGDSSDTSAARTLDVNYVYTVVDRRTVNVSAGSFDVYVIAFTTRTLDQNASVTKELTQQFWFSPFVGEVKDEAGNFLVASNVLKPDEGGDGSAPAGSAP